MTVPNSDNIIPVWLVELHSPSLVQGGTNLLPSKDQWAAWVMRGFLRVSTAAHDMVVGGNTYLGGGQLADTEEMTLKHVSLSFDIPNENLQLVLSQQYEGHSAKLWLGFLNEQHLLIADPIGPWVYAVGAMHISAGEYATVRWIFRRPSFRVET